MTRDGYHHGDLARALRDVARAHVESAGPDGFSLRAAAREIGVSPSAVYRHYADREALMAAVASEGFARLAAAMACDDPDPWARFRAVGEAYVRFACAEPGVFRLMFGPWGAASGRVDVRGADAHGRDPYAHLRDAIVTLGEAGLVRPDDPDALALDAWVVVHGVATLALDGPLGRDRVELALPRALDLACRGIAAPGRWPG